MKLEHWIDPRWLEPATRRELAARFAVDPQDSLAIDGLLRPDRLEGLRRLFTVEGRFVEEFCRKAQADDPSRQEVAVSEESFRSLPEEQRASVEALLAGPMPGFELGRGMLCHLGFSVLLNSPEFHAFLESVTGIEPGEVLGVMTRRFGPGHFLTPHSDSTDGRRLCAVFYVSDGWQPAYGGRFRHYPGTGDPVEVAPLGNRLLLFRPLPHRVHDVEMLNPAAGGWRRCAYTIWYGRKEEKAEPATGAGRSPDVSAS